MTARYKPPKATDSDQVLGIVLNKKDRNFVVPSDHKLDKDMENGLRRSPFALNQAFLAFVAPLLFICAPCLISLLFLFSFNLSAFYGFLCFSIGCT